MTSTNYLRIIRIAKVIVAVVLLLILLFFSAGTLNWPEAWLFLTFYLLAVGGFVLWLKRNDPDLLRERMSPKEDVKSWDKKIVFAYTLLLMVMLALAGIDAVRFRWSKVPFSLKILGFLGLFSAMALIFWATYHNTYLSQWVRIQKDRNHKVCTTGPYKYVRHPMYVGVIVCIISLPLALGSLYALLPGSIISCLFIIRTSLEDKTLQGELPGYKEYAKRVSYKLIPMIW